MIPTYHENGETRHPLWKAVRMLLLLTYNEGITILAPYVILPNGLNSELTQMLCRNSPELSVLRESKCLIFPVLTPRCP